MKGIKLLKLIIEVLQLIIV